MQEKEAVLKLGVLPAGGNPAALPGAAASTLAAEPDTSEAHECGYAPRSNRSSSQLKPVSLSSDPSFGLFSPCTKVCPCACNLVSNWSLHVQASIGDWAFCRC